MIKRIPTLNIYESHGLNYKQRFWWRLKAANGRIVATSGEGYVTWAKAKRAFMTAMSCGIKARYVKARG